MEMVVGNAPATAGVQAEMISHLPQQTGLADFLVTRLAVVKADERSLSLPPGIAQETGAEADMRNSGMRCHAQVIGEIVADEADVRNRHRDVRNRHRPLTIVIAIEAEAADMRIRKLLGAAAGKTSVQEIGEAEAETDMTRALGSAQVTGETVVVEADVRNRHRLLGSALATGETVAEADAKNHSGSVPEIMDIMEVEVEAGVHQDERRDLEAVIRRR